MTGLFQLPNTHIHIMIPSSLPTFTAVPLVRTGIPITVAVLRAKGACEEGVKLFVERYGEDGAPDYQEVLHALAESSSTSIANWLMRAMGAAQTETVVEGGLEVVGNVFVAGSLRVHGGIKAVDGIKAGMGIKAGWGIEAGWVQCSLRIFAGLVAWRLPEPHELEIRAELRGGTIAHGVLVEPAKND